MHRRTLVSIFCVAMFAACTKPEETREVSPESATSSEQVVKVTKVTSGVLDRELLLPGEILPYQDVPLYPKIPGFIKWIGVDRGYYVKKGQLLVEMIAPEVKATRDEASAKQAQASANTEAAKRKLQTARANQVRAESKYKADNDTYLRMKRAAEVPGVISGNELEDWRQKAEVDQAEVDACRELVSAAAAELVASQKALIASKQAVDHQSDLLQYLKITAPYDGMITERNMHEGSFAYPPHGQDGYTPMLRIKQLSLLRVVIPVPDYAVDGVDVGTPIKFTVSAYPTRVYEGKVARIAHSLDPKTRTEPVELNYWNTDRTVDPGMFPQVRWPMKRSYKTLFVPITSVYTSLETPIVVRIRDGKVQWVQVRRGQVMEDKVEVFGDLAEGDTIAIAGSDDIPEGTPVRTETVSANAK
ncbi:MAG: efflux RND transporter periplasmic adaptor subunit [Candidatus Obscuribacterales bacterium]|nr:efflux RND transporter periplasmic adaptor subunit [Candidatus Obscuribacterales bacterium]